MIAKRVTRANLSTCLTRGLEPLENRTMLSASLPDMATINGPASNPVLPAGFDVFVPPVSAAAPAAGAPVLANWTNSGNVNDTLVVTGKSLSSLTGPSLGTDTQFFTYGQSTTGNGSLAADPVISNDGAKAAVSLSGANTPNSLYLLWAGNSSGFSSPVAINKAQAWWAGPSQTAAGATVSVYGQNLSYDGGTTSSWVYITQAGSSTGQWAAVGSVNPYQVQFTVPSDLANGNYQVWVHNGEGGKYGWSSPVTMTVANAVAYNGAIFNVKDYGAAGNGIKDDTAAINKAQAAAMRSHNATVYFPAGTYIISSQLGFGQADGSAFQVIGDSAGSTVIKCSSSFAKSGYAMLALWSGNARFANFTLDTNSVSTVVSAIDARSQSGVQLSGLTVNAHLTQYFYLNGATNVSISNSSFTGDGGFLGAASQLFIDGCSFHGTNDANVMLYSWGGHDISITNCTAADLDSSNAKSGAGWATGRFFVGTSFWGTESNVYLAGNTTTSLGVRPALADQNQGEQILFEGQNLDLYANAKLVAAGGNTITMKGLPSKFSIAGMDVVILNGTGLGQVRTIVGYNKVTGVITLNAPWNVVPDSTSIVRIGEITTQVVVYNNHLSGKGATNTASAGINLFGGCINCIVDSNTIDNVRIGVCAFSPPQAHELLPIYFDVIKNNTVTNSGTGVMLYAYGTSGDVGFLGDMVLGNVLNGLSVQSIQIVTSDDGDDLDINVISDNATANTPQSISHPTSGSAPKSLLIINSSSAAPALAPAAPAPAPVVVVKKKLPTPTSVAAQMNTASMNAGQIDPKKKLKLNLKAINPLLVSV